jgi:hypothetical protein
MLFNLLSKFIISEKQSLEICRVMDHPLKSIYMGDWCFRDGIPRDDWLEKVGRRSF